MKIIVAFVAFFASILVFSGVRAEEEWTFVGRETKVQQFSLSQKGKLSFEKNELKGFELDQAADRVAISPISPDGKFAVAFAFGDQETCYMLDLTGSTAQTVAIDPSPLVWSNWAPEGNWLLLGSFNDQGMTLYSITPGPLQVRKIKVGIARENEVEEFNTGSVNWVSPNVFEVEASTHCSPNAPGCDDERQEQIIRELKLKIDAATLETLEKSEIKSVELPG